MIFTRWRTSPPEPVLINEPDPDLLLRYLTLGGAEVEVRAHSFRHHVPHCWCNSIYQRTHAEPGKEHVYLDMSGFRAWCGGCGQHLPRPGWSSDPDFHPGEGKDVREAANEHAGSCRALPSRLVRPA